MFQCFDALAVGSATMEQPSPKIMAFIGGLYSCQYMTSVPFPPSHWKIHDHSHHAEYQPNMIRPIILKDFKKGVKTLCRSEMIPIEAFWTGDGEAHIAHRTIYSNLQNIAGSSGGHNMINLKPGHIKQF